MVLKISILAVYIIVLLRLGVIWRRCKFAMSGNEMILFLSFVPMALVVPGDICSLLMRISLHVILFGFCIFWHMLLPKGMRVIIGSALVVLVAMLLLELVIFLLQARVACREYLYMFMGYGLCVYMYLTFMLRRQEEKFLKSIFSIGRLCNAVLAGIFPALLGCAVLSFYRLFVSNIYISSGAVAMISAIPIMYMVRYKPSCMSYNELVQIRKKAYILGRTVKDGQLLEDDGGILNGSVVDDARILCSIMTLFEEEKLYRNYDIKIADVARRIGTNKTYLSRALNTRVSKNFCQFVNHYRIREICLLYLEDTGRDIKALSEQCGFSSQSNFSIVFKYNTGYTPGDWCRMVKTKLENNEQVQVDDYML